MKTVACLLCVLLALVGVGCGKKAADPNAPDLSTPEASVRAFYDAFGKGDLNRASLCVVGGKPSPMLAAIQQDVQKRLGSVSYSNVVAKIDGTNATVTLHVVFRTRAGQPDENDSTVSLVQT